MKISKKLLLVFCLLIMTRLTANSQITLTVEVTELRNNKGQLLFQLMDENKKTIKSIFGIIKNKKCIMTFDDLKPAKYAFRYFLDENTNKKLDTKWYGIPVEGFGFSNNAKGLFGPPAFEKWIFDFNATITLICKPTYYL